MAGVRKCWVRKAQVPQDFLSSTLDSVWLPREAKPTETKKKIHKDPALTAWLVAQRTLLF